jgi:hypothetical protein
VQLLNIYFVDALAAEAYAKAAFNFLEYGSKHDAATQYVNASNILKKTDVLSEYQR